MPTPDEHDPRTPRPMAPRGLDPLDAPPPTCARPERRRPVAGGEACAVLAGTMLLVAVVMLVLVAVLPVWCRGFILLAAPALVGGVLSRFRLPEWGTTVLAVAAAAYAGTLLLTIG